MTCRESELKQLAAKAEDYLKGIGRKENLFSVNERDAVFVAVDMQNFVCQKDSGRCLPGIARVMLSVNEMADFCHARGIPVIWLRQCFSRRGGWDDEGLYGFFHNQPIEPGMFNQGEAAKIHPEMHLDPELDFVAEKNRYSAFAPGSSRLETLLSGLNRKQLIFGGAATNVCVESTARDAMQRGYQVIVLSDATTAFDNVLHEVSLLNIRLFFGDVRSVKDITREIGGFESFFA
ncbi:cysteine hydrolase [Dethiosulfatarculus sandiegensis]|uniref:cysteine hydrolase n=1 Tax=Dethiosulfatarculus sandiegensis TaxID=1429043 RepID=UPI000697157B|nr:cysteine hydrolase [Dethiosulfatarculus sandiegensis]